MHGFRTLDDIDDLSGKRVLLRVDLNVPMKDGKITDMTRIERITPTIIEPATPTANMDMTKRMLQPSYTGPFNLLGYPGLAIPSGFSSEGLPLSTQIVGAPFSEALLFRVGHAYQQVTDFHLQVSEVAVGVTA